MQTPSHLNRVTKYILNNAFLLGLTSLIWFLLRTGRKPSRAVYPCQRIAAVNSQIWLASYVFPIFSVVSGRRSSFLDRKKLAVIAAVLVVGSSLVAYGWWSQIKTGGETPNQAITLTGLNLTGRTASYEPASDLFVVGDTSGNDGGLVELIDLMGDHGLYFYKTDEPGESQGPGGLIASDDVVIIKVNCQWNERGGTNTDLLKALIQAILDHPEGFTGEIIVADNGQGQYGSSGRGGSLDWARSNAEDTYQSAQKVVDSFAASVDISTYLWDAITTTRVEEYSDGDMEDGYIVNETANPRTGIMVSYPKFTTIHGTHVSFKHGIWNPQTGTYDGDRLKVINVPVLKTHSGYGVTACVKHYMGVPSDKLTARLGSRTHNTIGRGGMGTLMVETRFPVLNILDAIWVNANPAGAGRGAGPSTPYGRATRTNVILASTDPVALDYWAAKHILIQAAPKEADTSSMNPDNTQSGSFGAWLRLSMQEITRADHQATVDEDHMNVYVVRLVP